jgi:membrane protein YdbS with pleckstrin-like domain
MGYVDKILQPGEVIKHVSRITWLVYLPGLSLAIVGLIGLTLLPPGQTNSFLIGIVGLVIALGTLSIFHAWFRRWTTEIAVTNRRVIYKRGFIRRHTIEMNMDKIESVDVDQSIIGRLFNYGTITVHGTGTGIEPFYQIDSPLAFRNNVTAQ